MEIKISVNNPGCNELSEKAIVLNPCCIQNLCCVAKENDVKPGKCAANILMKRCLALLRQSHVNHGNARKQGKQLPLTIDSDLAKKIEALHTLFNSQ